MRVHLVRKESVEAFVRNNARSRSSVYRWMALVNKADWKEPQDIVRTFNQSDILGRNSQRVVFDIGGNAYRLICKYHFGEQRVHLFIKWIGSHAEYTRLCENRMQFEISLF